jgi:hypothetical protein
MGREATQTGRQNKGYLSKAGIYSLPEPGAFKLV